MMRRSLAACLGACLLFGTLALAPDDAAAWLINQPRYEKQVVTEGDPDSPGINAPAPNPDAGTAGVSIEGSVTSVLLQIIDVVGQLTSF